MKKFLYFGFLVVCLIMFSGCSTKTLNCSLDDDYSEDMKMHQDLKIKFSGNKITKLYMSMYVDLDGDYLSSKDFLFDSVKSEFANISNEKGVSLSSSDKENGFKVSLKINFNKLKDDVKKQVSIVDYEKSYDYIRNDLEQVGYICK